jgi:hypothetical protein
MEIKIGLVGATARLSRTVIRVHFADLRRRGNPMSSTDDMRAVVEKERTDRHNVGVQLWGFRLHPAELGSWPTTWPTTSQRALNTANSVSFQNTTSPTPSASTTSTSTSPSTITANVA